MVFLGRSRKRESGEIRRKFHHNAKGQPIQPPQSIVAPEVLIQRGQKKKQAVEWTGKKAS